MDTHRHSVSTFGHVFDPTPQADVLTLAELVAALHRFQLRTDLAQRQARDVERARAAAAAIRSRTPTGGPIARRLEGHLGQTGDLDLALAELEREIHREAIQDLRLWSPARFADGLRREEANVVHLSCIVMDFDRLVDHAASERLRDAFAGWFHIAHSTWSHTGQAPKVRIILPLAAPLAPADYDRVWRAMSRLAGDSADPKGRALARAWALPATPDANAPLLAWSHAGPLLDPVAMGLAAATALAVLPPTGLSLMHPDPAETYLSATSSAAAISATMTTLVPGGSTPAPSATTALEERIAALESRLALTESRLAAAEQALAATTPR